MALIRASSLPERQRALRTLINVAKADPATMEQMRKLTEEGDLATEGSPHQLRPLPLATMICNHLSNIDGEVVTPVLTDLQHAMVNEWVTGWKSADSLGAAGIRPPGPLLLHGPTGTGKTTLAESLRLLLGLGAVRIDAHKVMDSHMAESGKNLSAAFEAANRAGNLLVIEEMDALAAQRAALTDSGAAQESNRVTVALMRLMDNPKIPVVATTNLLGALDSALLRRFEFKVEMPEPSIPTKRNILAQFLGKDGSAALNDDELEQSLALLVPIARRAQRRAFPKGNPVEEIRRLISKEKKDEM